MKEFRISYVELLEAPSEPLFRELYLRRILVSAGFNLRKYVKFYEDIEKNEYVYTQEES